VSGHRQTPHRVVQHLQQAHVTCLMKAYNQLQWHSPVQSQQMCRTPRAPQPPWATHPPPPGKLLLYNAGSCHAFEHSRQAVPRPLQLRCSSLPSCVVARFTQKPPPLPCCIDSTAKQSVQRRAGRRHNQTLTHLQNTLKAMPAAAICQGAAVIRHTLRSRNTNPIQKGLHAMHSQKNHL